jgi:hypothetical protein
MAIVAADLKKRGAANYPEADTGTSGGAISTTTQLKKFTQASNTAPKAASSNAADTMTLTLFGRLTTGVIDSEANALTGTTQITFTKTFSSILKATLGSAAAGTVTIFMNNGSTVIVTIDPGFTKQIALFYASESEGSTVVRYEKEHWSNTHESLTLQAANLKLTADPSAKIKVGVESSGSQSVTNRKTAPGSVSFVDDNVDINLSTLAAGASVGIWVEQTLTANDTAFNSTYTTELRGTTAA